MSRGEMRRVSQDLLHRLRPLLTDISALRAESTKNLEAAATHSRTTKIQARLHQTSLRDLAARQGISQAGLNNLMQRGIRTAAQVRSSRGTLTNVQGIGAKSAQKLTVRAEDLATTRIDDLHIPAAPDLWSGADETLARALQFWHRVMGGLSKAPIGALAELVADIESAFRRSSRVRWAFTRPRRRRQILEGFEELRQRTAAFDERGDLRLVETKLKDLQHHRGLPGDRSYWKQHSADLIAELEDFQASCGDEATRAALTHALPRSGLSVILIGQMEALNLDLSLVKRKLRAYQDQGARFAVCVRGGLLGDDMGLGKTTQALAAIAHCIATEGKRHHIVVCPASLLANWESEISNVLDGVSAWRFHGVDRGESLNSWERRGGILLAPFHLAPLLDSLGMPFGFLVIDEAHSFKDPSRKRSQLVRRLSSMAERILLLTGTPLVNHQDDVKNLLAIVDKGLAANLELRFSQADDIVRDAGAFKHAVSGHYLRRNRQEVLIELPPLTLIDVPVELSAKEVAAYRSAVVGGHLAQMRIAASISRGRESSKMAALDTIIEEARAEDRKVLVFSEFVDVLIAAHAGIGSDSYLVHGNVGSSREIEHRESAFARHEKFAALVYQIRMGNLGKNFQAASTVVLMEPQFTSTVELQAVSRAHRMGQTEPVVCHRLVAVGTVDERLVELVGVKAELINELVNESDLADSLGRRFSRPSDAELVDSERRRLDLQVG